MNWNTGTREQIRDWLQSIMTERNMSPIELAKFAGVSPTTVYRAIDVNSEFTTTTKTLEKIATAVGRQPPGPTYLDADHIKPWNSVSGLEAVDVPNGLILPAALDHHFQAYRILDRSLELEGYLPGDIVVIDEDVAPSAGDIVCVDLSGQRPGGSSRVLRLFEPPYLMSRSIDRRIEPAPILLDRSVEIRGTATAMLREMRRAS
ncbi:helix-turn-helix domain-containing protein [Agrobacterium sp. 22117]|uniref:helix-turn-helix domain-containing protein n=1 Tax=Agrobacterium sp. 22117 TaxID=3453880 RepID=UPI003F856EE9